MTSATPKNDIYTGFWINTSFGSVHGSTLTLSRQSGGFLIAFLALFVGATGRSFWKIARCIIHHAFSTKQPANGLHHQRQVLLRNSELAHEAAWSFLCVGYAWRKKHRGAFLHMLPMSCLAGIISIAFVTAGIFSSRITTSDMSEVLISGSGCGNISNQGPDNNNISTRRMQNELRIKEGIDSLAYALQCYRNESDHDVELCKTFAVPNLPYQMNTSYSCPFDGICHSSSDNLLIDSGYIDVRKHLGLNKGPNLRLRLKRQCAPIITKGFHQLHTDEVDPSVQIVRYYYGSAPVLGVNYTHQMRVNNSLPFRSDITGLFGRRTADYKTTAVYNYPEAEDFNFIPALNRTSSLVSLMFLDSTEVFNAHRVTDPWFFATKRQSNISNPIIFTADEPAGVLGCETSYEYCNADLPQNQSCENVFALSRTGVELWPDLQQNMEVVAFLLALGNPSIVSPHHYYQFKALSPLLTRHTLSIDGMQYDPLPKTRWKEEVEYIFQANLAAMQAAAIAHARADNLFRTAPCGRTIRCARICESQKLRSSRHYSFSVLGLGIILGLGGFIMLVGIWIESVTCFAYRIFARESSGGNPPYGHLEWEAQSTLQLQRQAHESLGLGTWSHTYKAVPVTERGEELGVLDCGDRKHVRLVHPDVVGSDVEKRSRREESEESKEMDGRLLSDES
ncbi:hypothetical protein B0J11DRAFT_522347 [Dendryphion nanum]|uniref:Uncharacterized protein n=1 Tax=Dendryphion nanum TaxID=256645 RepID=A0A9P9E3R3_9PLEO|nr:hypothetical protein B0J11DRAFT_522347 [Dendryphion nanum]